MAAAQNPDLGSLTFARIAALQARPIQGEFDASHLRNIHQYIFSGLTDHAPGLYRPPAPSHAKCRALESHPIRYYVNYANASEIEQGLHQVLDGIVADLRKITQPTLDKEAFASRMAKLYGDLDYLHPFVEGNSRTLRTFTAQLAKEVDVSLTWDTLNVNEQVRDRLYVARDREVTLRKYPGLDEARAMKTNDVTEYEAFNHFVDPEGTFSDFKNLSQLISANIQPLENTQKHSLKR